MWSTIIPELMSTTVFALTMLFLQAGRSPSFLQDYEILSINTTGLKANYYNSTNQPLPIRDAYNLYITTHCEGYYKNLSSLPLIDVTCSPPSSYSKFLLGTLISSELSANHSNATLTSLSFPSQIQHNFNEHFNLYLCVAFIFYILASIWTAVTILWGLLCFWKGGLAAVAPLFTYTASTCLFIATVIATVVQNEAAALINDVGNTIGVSAYTGSGFSALTWTAFGLSFVSSAVWAFAGIASASFRKSW